MKRGYALLIALVLCLSSIHLASAQFGPGGRGQGRMGMRGGGGLMLLGIPEVQKELKMTPEQVEKLRAKQSEVLQAIRDIRQKAGGPQAIQNMSAEDQQKLMDKVQAVQNKAVAEILNADQQKRFRQLELQQAGVGAFMRKDVIEELKLTKEQTEKIRALQREQQQAVRGAFQGVDFRNMTPEDREKMQAKMAGLRKAALDKALAVLTEEQQKQWKGMLGEPFKFPARMPGQRGGAGPQAMSLDPVVVS